MRDRIRLIFGLLCLCLTGCGPMDRESDSVFADGGRPDATPTPPTQEECVAQLTSDLWPKVCGTECTSLRYDAQNCGVCANACGAGGDTCFDGVCRCGEAGTCPSGTFCVPQLDQCLAPDASGPSCDTIDAGCENTLHVCVQGHCTLPNPGPEVCDGFDNDLDGYVDELSPGVPLVETCYSGPPGTIDVGICEDGYRICGNGDWGACEGEQPPVMENGLLSCDGLDNDCDNCPDGAWIDGVCVIMPPVLVDIVFVIDRSGSMGGYIAATVSAVATLASTLGTNPNVAFALVDPTDPIAPDGLSVTQPLTDYATFNTVIATVTANGSGTEPMQYAAQRVADGTLDAAIGFRSSSLRIILSIGDESTLTSGNSVPGYDETAMCGVMTSTGTLLAVVTDPAWYSEWDACTSSLPSPPSPVPQTAFALTTDAATMLSNLNLSFGSACSGP